MFAVIIARTYSAGTPFYIVECGTCNTLLNSGHHYNELMYANREADRHDAEVHGMESVSTEELQANGVIF